MPTEQLILIVILHHKINYLGSFKWYEEHVKRFLTIRRFNISANYITMKAVLKTADITK